MTTIELYINNRLVDIESPESFSIYLKRQMINPAELSRKDAQKSYDITLPATATNNEIFGHRNVEEVKNKFATLYDARLWVGGVNIFEGKFKLSEITRTSYKGNLGIPAQKSTKDIFGDKNMNEAGEWFTRFESISAITALNKEENPEIIFPFVLYGLMDKGMTDEDDGAVVDCSAKDVLDTSVRFRYDDFKPSVNCIELLKHLFENEQLTLSGSALEDERISKLYASYKNPDDYNPKWPQGIIKISGKWNNTYQKNGKNYFDDVYEVNEERPEKKVALAVAKATYIKRLLSAANRETDTEAKCLNQTIEADIWNSVNLNEKHIRIPVSGLYKIKLKADVKIDGEISVENLRRPFGDFFYFVADPKKNKYRTLNSVMVEVKLLQDLPEFGELTKNEDQNHPTVYTDNLYVSHQKESLYPSGSEVNFIDENDNKFMLCGLSWGRPADYNEKVSGISPFLIYNNPAGNAPYCNLLAAKNAVTGDNDPPLKATASKGYVTEKGILTDNYKLEINDAPENTISIASDFKSGKGEINLVVWLDVNTKLTPVCTSSLRKETIDGSLNEYYWADLSITYDLEIEPFKYTQDWLKVNSEGKNSGVMKWDVPSDFKAGQLDIVKFLPSNVKINDWVDNFSKAFNLELRQVNATEYELNTRKVRIGTETSNIIDLDAKADLKQCSNQSLQLPYAYDLGFTIDKNEQGYWESMIKGEYGEPDINTAVDGGGIYYTQSPEEMKLQQKSSFSYNWYKKIIDKRNGAKEIEVPIISDKEAWADTIYDYGKYNSKRYFDKAQRFWYRDGEKCLKIDLSDQSSATQSGSGNGAAGQAADSIEVALVTNEYKSEGKRLSLNYKNDPNTIMTSYFLLLVDAGNSYTTVECYLTPEEYASIADSWVRFNGDLYSVAEVDGFDPMCHRQATLKLIRKML